MTFRSLTAAIVLAVFFVGCASTTGEKETIGTVLGAAGGGLLGSQFGSGSGQLAATAAGTLLGALTGSNIGRTMDEVDRMKARQALEQATHAPIGETITWNNPPSGHQGSVTPVREGHSSSGNYCREFQQTVTIGGRSDRLYGTACRQPDGSWKLVQ
ncbi:RT0821/Lpp0805 family surface protein [Nitrosococcus wardiae]|uniref:Glycine zipper 2TM domain-containing protein n=1 Tax=Nitrosococcus wardiae TaxID=1814290 RepID=A0A4P7BUH6_9GAMM|nr:RT0821/Lpp0805 family surface protein [Nitrosococcus wardiae]QBQ53593.1 glycine zipper 2TM domain-containing protein [Nitrosococcus wardiae]